MIKTPWHSRLAFALALALPVYFAIAALGTKFGLWDWRTGLLTLTIKAGPILLGIVALATDTANPPVFSQTVLDQRAAAGANPLNDYTTPLGELEMWSEFEPPLADRSHAQVIAAAYPDLAPLPLGSTSPAEASELVVSAMEEMGFDQVTADAETGRIEGVAETFWFGFKDDMVVRIADGAIDFRSVSRVGVSDLGANAARIAALRDAVAERLNR